MISKIAQRMAYFFAEKKFIKPEEKDIYSYGYEIMISETINWVITFVIAVITQRIMETFFYMLAFMRLRGALGGFHAKSHLGCIVISTAVYVVCLFILYGTPINAYWILAVVGLILHIGLVFAIAPVAHTNKPFVNKEEYFKFRKKSYRLSVIYAIVCLVLMTFQWEIFKIYGYAILLGMLSASISMLIEHIKQKETISFRKGGAANEKY